VSANHILQNFLSAENFPDGLYTGQDKFTQNAKPLISCSKSANKSLTSCVRTACPKLSTRLEQVVNNL
jgi:hypothetical protein